MTLHTKSSDGGAFIAGARIRVWDAAFTTLYADVATDGLGDSQANLDDGTYTTVSSVQSFSPRTLDVTVASDPDSFHIQMVPISYPPSGDVDRCVMHFWTRDHVGTDIEGMTVQVRYNRSSSVRVGDAVVPPGWGTSAETDAQGHAQFDLARTVLTEPTTTMLLETLRIDDWEGFELEFYVPAADTSSANVVDHLIQ